MVLMMYILCLVGFCLAFLDMYLTSFTHYALFCYALYIPSLRTSVTQILLRILYVGHHAVTQLGILYFTYSFGMTA